MIAVLRQRAQGYNAQGEPIPFEEQRAAIQQYQDIQNSKAQRLNEKARQESDAQLAEARAEAERKRAESDRIRAETEAEVERRRVAVEENRLRLEAVQASERLQLEAHTLTERLQIEKAEVLVKALQVAVDGGVDPNQLLAAIQGLGDRLLPGPTDALSPTDAPPLQLEDKKGTD